LVWHHIFILIWVGKRYLLWLILLFILPCFSLPSEAVGLLVMSLNDWFLVSLDEWPTLRGSWCWCKSSGRVPQLMRPFLSQISISERFVLAPTSLPDSSCDILSYLYKIYTARADKKQVWNRGCGRITWQTLVFCDERLEESLFQWNRKEIKQIKQPGHGSVQDSPQ